MKHGCYDSSDAKTIEENQRGTWVKTKVKGQRRQKCNYCGALDERDVWVDGIYCGPKSPEPKYPGGEKYRYWNISKIGAIWRFLK